MGEYNRVISADISSVSPSSGRLIERANAQNVSLLTLYGGQLTLSTQLITLNYPKIISVIFNRFLQPFWSQKWLERHYISEAFYGDKLYLFFFFNLFFLARDMWKTSNMLPLSNDFIWKYSTATRVQNKVRFRFKTFLFPRAISHKRNLKS